MSDKKEKDKKVKVKQPLGKLDFDYPCIIELERPNNEVIEIKISLKKKENK